MRLTGISHNFKQQNLKISSQIVNQKGDIYMAKARKSKKVKEKKSKKVIKGKGKVCEFC